MKLRKKEVEQMKADYRAMIEHPTCRLQYVLAQYWLDRLERKGKYALLSGPRLAPLAKRRDGE